MSRLAGWGLVVLVLAAGPVAVDAAVIQVPEDVLHLDRALDLAQNGDTVLVAPGLYPGPFRLPPGVRLEAALGPGVTILEAPGSSRLLHAQSGGPTTAVVGFSFSAGVVGIELERGVLQIVRCQISGVDSIGVYCGPGSHARILATEFTGLDLGIVVDRGADVEIAGCIFAKNEVGVLAAAEDVRVYRNRFEENGVGVRVAVLGSARVGGSLRTGNDFFANPVAVHNLSDAEIQASHNYWGAVNCDSVTAVVTGPAITLPFTDESHRRVIGECP